MDSEEILNTYSVGFGPRAYQKEMKKNIGSITLKYQQPAQQFLLTGDHHHHMHIGVCKWVKGFAIKCYITYVDIESGCEFGPTAPLIELIDGWM